MACGQALAGPRRPGGQAAKPLPGLGGQAARWPAARPLPALAGQPARGQAARWPDGLAALAGP
eukprot:14528810-Heterocapsa_arctica.AAC.1